jgi:hypothetical protein
MREMQGQTLDQTGLDALNWLDGFWKTLARLTGDIAVALFAQLFVDLLSGEFNHGVLSVMLWLGATWFGMKLAGNVVTPRRWHGLILVGTIHVIAFVCLIASMMKQPGWVDPFIDFVVAGICLYAASIVALRFFGRSRT